MRRLTYSFGISLSFGTRLHGFQNPPTWLSGRGSEQEHHDRLRGLIHSMEGIVPVRRSRRFRITDTLRAVGARTGGKLTRSQLVLRHSPFLLGRLLELSASQGRLLDSIHPHDAAASRMASTPWDCCPRTNGGTRRLPRYSCRGGLVRLQSQ